MPRSLAIVTGASSGLGRELAVLCADNGFDLLIAAEDPGIYEVAEGFRATGVGVDEVETDLATIEGVDQLYAAINGRRVDALLATAGHGLGRAFLDQGIDEVRHLIDTNITGTLYLTQRVARDMRARHKGRILLTGAIAGFIPGAHSAVYNGTKAFIDSFSAALRAELKGSGVTVTCLMPGPTDTELLARAGMLDTKMVREEKDDASEVARVGFEAMLRGEADVAGGWTRKLQSTIGNIPPARALADQHQRMTEN